MNLEEAINHLKEALADENKDWSCEECKNEHIQLLEWLEELKRLRHDVQKWIDFCGELVKEEKKLRKLLLRLLELKGERP